MMVKDSEQQKVERGSNNIGASPDKGPDTKCTLNTKSSCSSNWGIFSNETLLTETQVNEHPTYCQQRADNKTVSKSRCIDDHWIQGALDLFVHPPSKFAFFMIPKNGRNLWSVGKVFMGHTGLLGCTSSFKRKHMTSSNFCNSTFIF